MKTRYLLIIACSLISGSIVVAHQNQQPKAAQQAQPCCHNGKCANHAQPRQQAAPAQNQQAAPANTQRK